MSPIIVEGLYLAMYGMGTVFLFLTLLVLATMLMSRLTAAFAPEQPLARETSGIDARKRAIIEAAIQQHRQR